jgi:ribosomal protein S27AE
MNFIGTMEGEKIEVELKYCERCGGLWLRAQGADGVHCASCRVRLEARPDPGIAPVRKARRSARNTGKTARIEHLQGVATMEVWA